ncbi:uncharacterized protein LOC124127518 [Haliotis rufescens]|uniref:uncharacterized protein LOC124127518 n=1 Tax=Haliotis rufescens TaxID=6454 RepID=UPI00201EF498|nr:uncharacterized protein LOC124127518 [Haliotis rufescens]
MTVRVTLCVMTMAVLGHVTGQYFGPTTHFRGIGRRFPSFLRGSQRAGACDDPCKSMTCSSGSTCRIVQSQCLISPCPLVPRCIRDRYAEDKVLVNPCLVNRPVMAASGNELGGCVDAGSTTCSIGSKCTRALYGQGSKCCYAPFGCQYKKPATHQSGVKPQPTNTTSTYCPSTTTHTTCEKGCIVSADCKHGYVCCPTACGTLSCALPKGSTVSTHRGLLRSERRGVKPVHVATHIRRPVVVGRNRGSVAVRSSFVPKRSGLYPTRGALLATSSNRVSPGQCRNMLQYRSCRNQCSEDSHCGVGKCCQTRCGTRICTYGRFGRYFG